MAQIVDKKVKNFQEAKRREKQTQERKYNEGERKSFSDVPVGCRFMSNRATYRKVSDGQNIGKAECLSGNDAIQAGKVGIFSRDFSVVQVFDRDNSKKPSANNASI